MIWKSEEKKDSKIKHRELLAAPGKELSAVALSALTEAALRRRESDARRLVCEDNVERSLEPTRYGDWEADGKCRDF